MNTARRLAVLPFVVLLAGCSGPYPPGPPVTSPALNRRVFLDVDRVRLPDVLEQIGRVVGIHASFDWSDARLQRDVTLRLSNVTTKTALDVLCETVGCGWALEGTTLKVVASAPPPPVPGSARFREALFVPMTGFWRYKDAPLAEILSELGHYAGLEVQIEGRARKHRSPRT